MNTLDHDTCYQAVTRRDPRFDGRFYTAVTTTGIFCRPSCPARTPKTTNVRFYRHAAAASDAGFRPCRRCRPELAPGHPEWNRRSDLTGRALKLIEGGTVDRIGVSGLAAQLGVSERHLRRELQSSVGTGPLPLARARRLWLARLLLDQTSLPITEVAFAAGFSSVRQFNDSMRKAFDAPPSALRRRVGTDPTATTVTLQLPARGPLRWSALHAFLAARAIPGLESASENGFRRQVDGGWIELSGPLVAAPTANAVGSGAGNSGVSGAEVPGSRVTGSEAATVDEGATLTLTCALDQLSALAELLPIVRRVADLDTDLEPIEAHLGADPTLAQRLQQTPLARLPGAFDPFEIAIRAVVGQQISVAGARTLLGRLVEMTSNGPTGTRCGFPSAEQVAESSLDELGMPGRRRATILGLARAVADGQLELGPHVDPDQARHDLQALPGIGPWTAGYVVMRALSDPDGWPVGDLALRRSLGCSARELEQRAATWSPWRAYAALTLWRSDPTQIRPSTNDKPKPSASKHSNDKTQKRQKRPRPKQVGREGQP